LNRLIKVEINLRTVYGAGVIFVAAIALLTWQLNRISETAAGFVLNAQMGMDALAQTRVLTSQIELATQNYRASGDRQRLVERNALMAQRERLLQSMQAQIEGNATLQSQWAALRAVVDERKNISHAIEVLRGTQGEAAAAAYANSAPLAATRQRLDKLVEAMDREERDLLAQRLDEQSTARRYLLLASVVASTALLLLLALSYWLVRRQLRQGQARLVSAINSVPVLLAFVDTRQRYVYVNAHYLARFGAGRTDITGCTVREILGEQRYPIAAPRIERVLAGEPQSYDWEPFPAVWQAINYLPSRDASGQIDGYFVLGTDITERKNFELALRGAAAVFDSSYEGILVTDAHGLISKVNPAFTRITGYAPEEVLGQSPRMLSSGRHDARFFAEFWSSLREKDYWHGEIWNRRKDGALYATLQSVSVVRGEQREVLQYVAVFADISQIKAHEAELDHVANFDALTELPNRRLLSDRLTQSLYRADRSGKLCAVCFLDLDGFKLVNDQLGHDVGDQVLVGIAQHIKTVLRADDTLARLGGDEFIVLLSEVGSTEECAQILERVHDAVRRPVQAGVHSLSLSASIGVSLYPGDNVDPDTLLRHADQAMYMAKLAGKNRYQMFDPQLDRVAQDHRAFLLQLEHALLGQEFALHYQPKVNLVSGEVIGLEALIRWQHPQRGLVAPGEFLPQLHGSALEAVFGAWVIDTALTQLERWAQEGLKTQVSVNISANHLLQPEFSEQLRQALLRHPAVEPAALELEVLESAAIADMEQAVQVLQHCMELGVAFALDDFGTGYSSLTYLRKLPVHTLKIDQSFVRDMLVDAVDMGIVQGVIQLARVFQRQVIAEGVETLEHGAALRAMGCHLVQGYGVARPMPAQQVPAWCAQWQSRGEWRRI